MKEEEKLVCSSSLAYFCLRLPRSDPQPQIVKHLSRRWSRSQDDSTFFCKFVKWLCCHKSGILNKRTRVFSMIDESFLTSATLQMRSMSRKGNEIKAFYQIGVQLSLITYVSCPTIVVQTRQKHPTLGFVVPLERFFCYIYFILFVSLYSY